MASGTVAKFIEDKGFGFITPDGGGKDVFVHHSDIVGRNPTSLSPGQRVSFDLGKGKDDRPKAANVKPLN